MNNPEMLEAQEISRFFLLLNQITSSFKLSFSKVSTNPSVIRLGVLLPSLWSCKPGGYKVFMMGRGCVFSLP